MGQESSVLIDDDTPPVTLEARTIDAVAEYVHEYPVRKVVVMSGAGISTSAGIPDFRSPDTGLYANLAKLDLPYPEAVFDISFFRSNPLPFYTLAHELYPGKHYPTISHCFIRLLWDKGVLLKAFTQNIDCLERQAGVPAEAIVEAHGSFATHRCIECGYEFPDDRMKEAVLQHQVPRCVAEGCQGLVKPDIVFFGESLPEEFFLNRTLPAAADLCIVMGTSLAVQPFASLPGFCREGTPRLLINKERVGGLGSRTDDVLLLGDCDDGVRKLATALGWLEELEALWLQANPHASRGERPEASSEVALEDQISRLTGDIEDSLKISKDHTDRLKAELEKDKPKMIDSKEDLHCASKATMSKSTEKEASPIGNSSEGSLSHVFGHLKIKDETSNRSTKSLDRL